MKIIRFSRAFLSVLFFLGFLVTPPDCHPDELQEAGDSFSSALAQANEEGNFVFSPHGVETLAAMMAVGAKTETLTELHQAFHLPSDAEEIVALQREIEPRLTAKPEEKVPLLSANGLWVTEGLELSPAFREQITDGFHAGLTLHDFSVGRETNGHDINAWVQRQTAEKISVVTDGFAPETQMVLINAIYFCCDWLTAFDPANTKNCDFTTTTDEKIAVPMMRRQMRCPYFEDDAVVCVLLPYTQENLGMIFVLPKKAEDWNKSETVSSQSNIARWRKDMTLETVDCLIPKFRIESSIDLKPVFGQLGVQCAFDREKADFSGITDTRRLFVDEVVQKVTLEIGESGTEATAATTAVFAPKAPPNAMIEVVRFHADRPFYFAVVDKEKGTLIFTGRYVNPKQPESN